MAKKNERRWRWESNSDASQLCICQDIYSRRKMDRFDSFIHNRLHQRSTLKALNWFSHILSRLHYDVGTSLSSLARIRRWVRLTEYFCVRDIFSHISNIQWIQQPHPEIEKSLLLLFSYFFSISTSLEDIKSSINWIPKTTRKTEARLKEDCSIFHDVFVSHSCTARSSIVKYFIIIFFIRMQVFTWFWFRERFYSCDEARWWWNIWKQEKF